MSSNPKLSVGEQAELNSIGAKVLKSATSTRLGLAWISVLVCAISVRIFYFIETPVKMRGNDTDGHITYIDYLSNVNFSSLPNPALGAEYHQTPLYYYLQALLLKLEFIFHAHGLKNLMALSLVLCILSLLPLKGLATDLFDKNKADALLFFSLVAFLPGLLFFGGDINNDSLNLFLSFCFIWQLNKWWLQKENKSLFVVNCLVTLAIFAKASAAVFPLITLSAIALKQSLSKLEKIKLAAGHVGFIICSTGWYFVLRHITQNQMGLVGHLDHIPEGFRVANNFHTLTTFNPIKVLSTAYNDVLPWNFRRDYFWEFLYKSAYIGQLRYADSLKPYVVCAEFFGLAILALTILFFGITILRRKRVNAVMLGMLLVIPLAVFALRLHAPFACSQSFRFIPAAAIPIGYFATSSGRMLRNNVAFSFRTILWLACLSYLILDVMLSSSHPLN